MERDFATNNGDLWAGVYLCAGQQEAYGLAALTQSMGDTLDGRGFVSLRLRTQIHPRVDHAGAFDPGFESAMEFLNQ